MNVLALCSGIGGLELGLKLAEPTARTVCYVERETYPLAVTLARIRDGVLDDAPIWTDLKTFDGKPWRGVVDCITGGYPCQPFSYAGRRKGEDDPRHLWPDIRRIISEIQPRFCFFENVAGHLSLGFESVWGNLRDMGYQVEAGLFTAAEVGAPHKRQRLFFVAHANRRQPSRRRGESSRPNLARPYGQPPGSGELLAHTERPQRGSDDDTGRHLQQGSYGEGEATGRVGKRSQAMADTSNQRPERPRSARRGWTGFADGGRYVGNTDGSGSQRWVQSVDKGTDELPTWLPSPEDTDAWAEVLCLEASLEPAIRRVADGIPNRVDRLAATGNSVVPAVAATAWRQLRKEAIGDIL
jgi:DNA (cytosine-5)-methyltransferase 1